MRKLSFIKKFCLLSFGLIVFLSACSKEENAPEATTAPPPEVLNGVPIPSTEAPSVGLIKGPNFICTGTLIASNIVLTANHCVENSSKQIVPLQFTLSANLSTATNWTSVNSVQRLAAQDMAVVRLTTPINNIETSEISLNPVTQSFLNQRAEIVGYGDSATSSTPVREDSGAGVKRKGTSLLFRLDDNQATIVSKPSLTQQTVCPGDSGGPLYITYQGRKQIFGVASAVRWNGYCATVQEAYHKQVASTQTKTWLLNSLARWYTRVPIYRTVNPAGQFVFSKTGTGVPAFRLLNVPGNFSNATCTTPLLQCKSTSGTLFLNTNSCGTSGQFERLLGYACNGARNSSSSVGSFDLWRVDNVQQKSSLSTSLTEARQLSQRNSQWTIQGFLGVHVLSPQ